MGKVAFVFPGQGAQYPGMGRSLCEVSPAAAGVFRMADSLRPGTSSQCFSGTEEELKETKITQPCIWAVEMAAAAALNEAGIQADMTAGFSLGELSALSYAGVVDASTCFELVCERGRLMQDAAVAVETSMAAVVKLSHETVEEICTRFEGVYPVNYNCPGQVTVAGLKSSMADFSAAVKEAKGRALPLKVSGGFHSPFMAEASAAFGKLLEPVVFKTPAIPLYSNLTGLPYEGDMKHLLEKQICSPVRWEAIIRQMIAAGVDTFIEVGPGSVLQGLIGKIDKHVRVFGVSDAESLAKTIQEVKAC
ncbi:MAG: ACP S-malonyltransferase [Oscillospiraceae bacterium]|nr:ACP S-malonyltransferase [Oscillospiraceae bacterium]